MTRVAAWTAPSTPAMTDIMEPPLLQRMPWVKLSAVVLAFALIGVGYVYADDRLQNDAAAYEAVSAPAASVPKIRTQFLPAD